VELVLSLVARPVGIPGAFAFADTTMIDRQKLQEAFTLKLTHPFPLGPAWAKVYMTRMPMAKANWIDKIDKNFWSPSYHRHFIDNMAMVVQCKEWPSGSVFAGPQEDPQEWWEKKWSKVAIPAGDDSYTVKKTQRGPLGLPHRMSKRIVKISVCNDENDPLRFELPIYGTKEICALTFSPRPASKALDAMEMVLVARTSWKNCPTNTVIGDGSKMVLCEDRHVYVTFYAGSERGYLARQYVVHHHEGAMVMGLIQCTNIVRMIPNPAPTPVGVFGAPDAMIIPMPQPGFVRCRYGVIPRVAFEWNDTYRLFDMEGIDVSDPARRVLIFNHLRTQESNVYGLIKHWESTLHVDSPWSTISPDVFKQIVGLIPFPANPKVPLASFLAGLAE